MGCAVLAVSILGLFYFDEKGHFYRRLLELAPGYSLMLTTSAPRFLAFAGSLGIALALLGCVLVVKVGKEYQPPANK